jgi:peptidoglycan/LPS O-acetylase OafA/YrhL
VTTRVRHRLRRLGPVAIGASGFTGGSAYRPDLDGLRAIAIGLVMVTHAEWPWVNNGGDAGVTAFFVLSGYVITNLLLRQHEAGIPNIVGFYRRRLVRLGPALLGLLAFTLIVGVTVGWPTEWRLGIVSCLLYVSNWIEVAGVNIDPLGHTWSLAIEEQFYLVWPAVLFAVLRRRREWLIPIVVLAILAGAITRALSSGTFEYFSTFTRADAILLGCLIALTRVRLPGWVGVGGVAALVAVALWIPADNHGLAITVSMFAAAAIICGEVRPLGRLAPAGLRAYSLYLWNWPMTLLFGSLGLVAPLLTILIGELSFRLLEAPVLRRGGVRATAAAPSVAPGPVVVAPRPDS